MKVYSIFCGLLLILVNSSFLLAQEKKEFIEEKVFEVNKESFKLEIISTPNDTKIRVYKKISEKWLIQNSQDKESLIYQNFQVRDWNLDGFDDIRVAVRERGGPSEFESVLLLYDSLSKKHINIKDFWQYGGCYEPEERVVEGKNIFWSMYSRAFGYEGYVLFTIRDFRIVGLGAIDHNYYEPPQNYTIYKTDLSNPDEVKRQKLLTIYQDFNNDWDEFNMFGFWGLGLMNGRSNYEPFELDVKEFWEKYYPVFID